jgi:hypothetical protein
MLLHRGRGERRMCDQHTRGNAGSRDAATRHHEFSDGRGFSRICIPPTSETSSRVIVSMRNGPLRPSRTAGVLPSQPSVWERERHRAKSKHRAVEAPGASGNKAFACRTSCCTCETLRRGVRGVRSHNGVVKHREASGVASTRNGESGAGCAEAPAFTRLHAGVASLTDSERMNEHHSGS